ncbi:MAG: hypothetical protein AB7U05_09180 [Mangrovibacterium sp.]
MEKVYFKVPDYHYFRYKKLNEAEFDCLTIEFDEEMPNASICIESRSSYKTFDDAISKSKEIYNRFGLVEITEAEFKAAYQKAVDIIQKSI